MLDRADHREAVRRLLARNPVVALLGPRQVGKSTLARQIAAGWPRGATSYFDLEPPQLMPVGLDVTVPDPDPLLATMSV